MTAFIYGLNDPETGECRYLGKTTNPQRRLSQHIHRERTRTHKNCWVASLIARGLRPIMEIIDEVPLEEWEFWEKEYIRLYRIIGIRLSNLTDGGGGGMGKKHSFETCQRISETLKGRAGRKHSLETRNKLSAANMGRKRSLEVRARLSAIKMGRKRSPEVCAQLSIAQKKRWAKKRGANI